MFEFLVQQLERGETHGHPVGQTLALSAGTGHRAQKGLWACKVRHTELPKHCHQDLPNNHRAAQSPSSHMHTRSHTQRCTQPLREPADAAIHAPSSVHNTTSIRFTVITEEPAGGATHPTGPALCLHTIPEGWTGERTTVVSEALVPQFILQQVSAAGPRAEEPLRV